VRPGFVGRALVTDFSDLIESVGLDRAKALYGEVWSAYDQVYRVVAEERIDCHLERCGRFIPVFSQRQYDSFARKLEIQRVLEFFGQEAVARVVRESPKLSRPSDVKAN